MLFNNDNFCLLAFVSLKTTRFWLIINVINRLAIIFAVFAGFGYLSIHHKVTLFQPAFSVSCHSLPQQCDCVETATITLVNPKNQLEQ
jgi:hypothetical protein